MDETPPRRRDPRLEAVPSDAWIAASAAHALRAFADRVVETPLVPCERLSRELGLEVLFKCEHRQRTGSFKLRGATAKIDALDPDTAAVVCASTGNHGLAVATAAAAAGVPVTVFAPRTAQASKLAAIRELGAEVVQAGEDCIDAEAAARRAAQERGAAYLSPYNDSRVVAGQATLGLELWRQTGGNLGAVVVSLGGGGLASGVGAALREEARLAGYAAPLLIAASPAASAVMHHSLAAGEQLDLPSEETLSDGTAGGVEEHSITFPLCQRLVDRTVLVDEEEIAAGVRLAVQETGDAVEGAAGVAVAALRRLAVTEPRGLRGPVVVVLCGGNIGAEKLQQVLDTTA